MIKHILFIVLSIGFLGCSGEQMAHSITKTQIAMSGNKPPASFEFANVQTMRDYIFQANDFRFSLPRAKEKDFVVMGGWFGSSIRDGKTIVLNLNHRKIGINYHISLSASRVFEYSEDNRQLELNNISYFRKKYPKRVKDYSGGHITTYSLSQKISNYGRENYSCIISESRDEYQNRFGGKIKKYKNFYTCYKFNPSRTKTKKVTISLTYTKSPNLSNKYKSLAKEYTYQDLQKRAKRTLDSLYIKDGW